MASNTNTSISNIISSQVPFFVRSDHPNFVTFLEAYYEWMEQRGETVNVIKNIGDYFDVDKSVEQFLDELRESFISALPQEVITDKNLLLKHIKDFYRARGSEKSARFLIRILFGDIADDVDFYYPKADILRASDGKWFIEKSLKIAEAYIDGVATNDIDTIKSVFKKTKITGNTSGATAIVERVDEYYDAGTRIREIKVSNQSKNFESGETLFALYDDSMGVTHTISANTFSGIINEITIQKSGGGYTVGSIVPLEANSTGSNAVLQISDVSTGNIKTVYIIYGGAGYQTNNSILFVGGGGSGAAANVSEVDDSNFYHPNTYNILASYISLESNTAIGNNRYSNLNPSLSDPANSWIANSMTYFNYINVGPARKIVVTGVGNNYLTAPTASIVANTLVRALGMLGRMEIINGGRHYQIGDSITFNNTFGGFGVGATANVTNVDANGTITHVYFQETASFPRGGFGYDQNHLPDAVVVSANGNGANIIVTALLGFGANIVSVPDSLGSIREISIISGGDGFEVAPTLNLKYLGDGTAQAEASIVTGVYIYPGRFLNDDGHISAYNFLEDRDYYQPFSYVIKLDKSINDYRKAMKSLVHPAGMKLFGEYKFVDDALSTNTVYRDISTQNTIFVLGTYVATGNANGTTLNVTTLRSTTNTTNAYIELISGNAAGNVANGFYNVTHKAANNYVYTYSNVKVNGSGSLYTTV